MATYKWMFSDFKVDAGGDIILDVVGVFIIMLKTQEQNLVE